MSERATKSSEAAYCTRLVQDSLWQTGDKAFAENAWGRRHVRAWGSEPIARMVEAAATYADDYRKRYGVLIGDDGVLGQAWLTVVKGICGLLNGECGGLDCGTVDALLRDMAASQGFEDEL